MCIVVCPSFQRCHDLMIQFMRQVGCKVFSKEKFYIRDLENYKIMFISEQFMRQKIKGCHPDYIIFEEDFKEMWGIV